jgi:hypothetical protein
MSRDEEASLNARADEAKKRLRHGIEGSKQVVAQYRKRLLMLRAGLQPSEKRPLVPAGPRLTR